MSQSSEGASAKNSNLNLILNPYTLGAPATTWLAQAHLYWQFQETILDFAIGLVRGPSLSETLSKLSHLVTLNFAAMY